MQIDDLSLKSGHLFAQCAIDVVHIVRPAGRLHGRDVGHSHTAVE
jgi:hypothetical protein